MKSLVLIVIVAAVSSMAGWRLSATRHHLPVEMANKTELKPSRTAKSNSVEPLNLPSNGGGVTEEDWVAWSDSIQDSDLRRAILRLNPHYDIIPLRLLLGRLARIDGQGAIDLLGTLKVPDDTGEARPDGTMLVDYRRTLFDTILIQWSKANPEQASAFAIQFLAEQKSKPQRRNHPPSFEATRLAKLSEKQQAADNKPQDFLAEAEKVASLPSTEKRASAARDVLHGWLAKDPEAAAKWWQAQPEEMKARLGCNELEYPLDQAPPSLGLRLMMSSLGTSNLSSAIEAVSREGMNAFVLNHHNKMGTQRTLQWTAYRFGEWLNQSPQEALSWAQSQPTEELKSFFAGQAAWNLAKKGKSAEATALVDALPDASKPVALRGLVQGWGAHDAKATADWAMKIDDLACRDECLQTLLAVAQPSDPAWALQLTFDMSEPKASTAAQLSVLRQIRNDYDGARKIIEKAAAGDSARESELVHQLHELRTKAKGF